MSDTGDNLDDQLWLVEYQQAHEGYRSRDALIPREFSHMFTIFMLLMTLMAASKAFITFDRGFTAVVMLLLGLAGLVGLFAFLIDIEANASCKIALRKKCDELEVKHGRGTLEHCRVLATRQMYFEEELYKRRVLGMDVRSVADLFVVAARLILVLWIVLVIVVIFWGQSPTIG